MHIYKFTHIDTGRCYGGPMKGKVHSAETKLRMSEAAKNRKKINREII